MEMPIKTTPQYQLFDLLPSSQPKGHQPAVRCPLLPSLMITTSACKLISLYRYLSRLVPFHPALPSLGE